MQITDTDNLDGCFVVHLGTYADIYRGIENTPRPVTKHAYKTFRAVSGAVWQFQSMINGLVEQQSDILDHSHISPMSTVSVSIAGISIPAIKMPLYKNGNILLYLCRNVDADEGVLVTDVARGLAGLHSLGITHGNLHPGNILITDNCRACITDVGVYASVLQTIYNNHHPVPSQWPYKSPEELLHGIRTSHTDVYSFACTVYSIYTKEPLFKSGGHAYIRGMQKIIERGHGGILSGSKPLRMRQELWSLLRRCWTVDPTRRPTMMEVVEELSALALD